MGYKDRLIANTGNMEQHMPKTFVAFFAGFANQIMKICLTHIQIDPAPIRYLKQNICHKHARFSIAVCSTLSQALPLVVS